MGRVVRSVVRLCGGAGMAETASLEIHQINVSQGDSVLVINRDNHALETLIRATKKRPPSDPIDYVPFAIANNISLIGSVKSALLIDGGDDEFGGDVWDYMVRHGVVDPVEKLQSKLMVLVSHYHDDHQAGLRYIFKKRIDPAKRGDVVTFEERARPAVIYQAMLDRVTNSTTNAGIWLQGDIKAAVSTAPQSKLVPVYPGGLDKPGGKTTQISLGDGDTGLAINVYLLASSQYVYNKATAGIDKIPSVTKIVDQNDRSLVAVLEYGSFRCFLGGDIGGSGGLAGGNTGTNAMDTTTKKHYSTHPDVESVIGPALEAFFPATKTWIKSSHAAGDRSGHDDADLAVGAAAVRQHQGL